MSSLDPYDVLGISHNSCWNDVKKAYKNMLIKTHPDKMGSAKFFMLVHEAYSQLQKQYKGKAKETNMPKEKQKYSDSTNDVVQPKKMKNFTNNKFNQYFDQNRIHEQNPYEQGGYRQHMVDRLNYQEDISQVKTSSIHIPTQKIVQYKEPESLYSSKVLENVYHLGQDAIDDYSGGGGTDLMKAYCHIQGEPIDTVKRYKNIDDIQNHRSSENLEMTKEEKKIQRQLEHQRQKLEQLRLNNVSTGSHSINQKYTQLHRRLQ